MSIRIALAGNPNSGKTTLFNALTGSNQFVGNWPGVTVEKKEGKLKSDRSITITDLPGIYSLSPYTLEEVVARNYLLEERPDVILNIIDGTNLERNLFLTTQLAELGIPVVVAVNMMDVVLKNGDKIDTAKLGKRLGCKVFEISALKGTGIAEAVQGALDAAKTAGNFRPVHSFSAKVEQFLTAVSAKLPEHLPEEQRRFYSIKLFERDEKIMAALKVEEIEEIILAAEKEMDDDAESIITAERYHYIGDILKNCYWKKNRGGLTVSDKIDRVVTNRWLALPIFAAVMFLVYFVSVSTVGTYATDWANDGVFGDGWHLFGIGSAEMAEASEAFEAGTLTEEPDPADFGVWVPGIPVVVGGVLESINCAEWLQGLVVDGVIGGVGAVLGFVPQMLVLFFFLAFLEACGYMARIAFIMDRIFRKFGLSGKSFIPMLIGTGCGVPGIMASRTIENDRDRKMTIMTTTFIPCGAKLPIIALIAGALFGGAALCHMGCAQRVFRGHCGNHCFRRYTEKNEAVCGRPGAFCDGTARIPYADSERCAAEHVGERLVLRKKSGDYHIAFRYCNMVPFQFWFCKWFLWHGRGFKRWASGGYWFCYSCAVCAARLGKLAVGSSGSDGACCERKCCSDIRTALWLRRSGGRRRGGLGHAGSQLYACGGI